MKDHPGLRKQRQLHNSANPWILAMAIIAAGVIGFFLEEHGLTWVKIGDSSMAPRIREEQQTPVCLFESCGKHLIDDVAVLVRTPDRMKIRKIGALPGELVSLRAHAVFPLPSAEEPADLLLPKQGDVTDPSSWSAPAFDALLLPLLSELDSSERNRTTVRLRWIGGKETIEERIVPWHEVPVFYDMERHAAVLQSHRPGMKIKWERRIVLDGEPIHQHNWKQDHFLLEPETKGWSWWVLPRDSIAGKVIAPPRVADFLQKIYVWRTDAG